MGQVGTRQLDDLSIDELRIILITSHPSLTAHVTEKTKSEILEMLVTYGLTESIESSAARFFVYLVGGLGIPIVAVSRLVSTMYPLWGQLADVLRIVSDCMERRGGERPSFSSLENLEELDMLRGGIGGTSNWTTLWNERNRIAEVVHLMRRSAGDKCLYILGNHMVTKGHFPLIQHMMSTLLEPLVDLAAKINGTTGMIDRFLVFINWFSSFMGENWSFSASSLSFVITSLVSVRTVGQLFEEVILLRNNMLLQSALSKPAPTPFSNQPPLHRIITEKRCAELAKKVDPDGSLGILDICLRGGSPTIMTASMMDRIRVVLRDVREQLDETFGEIRTPMRSILDA